MLPALLMYGFLSWSIGMQWWKYTGPFGTSGVVTGRTFGCTKQNICAMLLEAQRFVSF